MNAIGNTPAAATATAAGQAVTPWLAVVLAVILLSGALFGYDQGVISGALHGIKATFSLSALLVEVVTSWVTLGALFGALAGGELADRLGRKRAVLIAGVVFTAGSLIEALAPDTLMLVGGRLIVGAGVGVAAVAAPLYAAELAPSALRGRFISAYQLAIAGGIFGAYLIDGWLSQDGAWRWMLGLSAAPGVLLVAVALVTPQSPRWLMRVARRADAAAQMRKICPGSDPGPGLGAIAAVLDKEKGRASWREVFGKKWRRPLLVGVGLAVFQQITGINAIIYYADQIFAAAGFATKAAQTTVTTWAVGWDRAAADKVPAVLRNTLGLAVGQATYQAYRDILESSRFQRLQNLGARPQRLLFASTGTKDKSASDTLYVAGLAAPDTVNTMPEDTLTAYAGHGAAPEPMPRDGGSARTVLAAYAEAGIDPHALAAQLQTEGAKGFVDSWRDLLAAIDAKSKVVA